MSFESLGLRAEILRAVREQGYTEPTPIQTRAIPVVLEGRDLMACAQTGTGKTAGFTLPLLQRLGARKADNPPRAIRALVLTPTRELAAQVADSIATYGRHLPLRTAVIFGGVKINPQIGALRRGIDIVVATPGRLLDHANQKTIDLSRVEILVLDEADRMLDMGFIHDIRRIMALLPDRTERQNLLFSATLSADIQQLASRLLNRPELLEVSPHKATVDKIRQLVHPTDAGRKRELLSHMIGAGNWRQVLVFTRTKHGANRLAKQLGEDGLSAAAIHGNKSQGARTRALAEFKSGAVRILVATDIAARGLDIDQLPHVVNFELPNVPEDYVHRIGRTGRAGQDGTAVSLVSADEHDMLRDIERLIRFEIPQQVVTGYEARTRPATATRETRGRSRQRNGGGRSGGSRSARGESGAVESGAPGRSGRRRKRQANKNSPARNGAGERQNQPRANERPAVVATHGRKRSPNRKASGNSAPRPGFSPLSERNFKDWDVN